MVLCDDLPGEDVLPAVVAVREFGPQHSVAPVMPAHDYTTARPAAVALDVVLGDLEHIPRREEPMAP